MPINDSGLQPTHGWSWLTDQHISYYSMSDWKTLKWWKKVLWRLLDIAIINSWIILRCNFPDLDINTQKAFLVEELVQPLLSLYSSPTYPAHLCGKGNNDSYLIGMHFPYTHPEGLQRRCVVCSYKVSPITGKCKDIKTKTHCPSSFVKESALNFITPVQSFNCFAL